VHIRHFGFLANRSRKAKLALCQSLLPVPQVVEDSPENDHRSPLIPITILLGSISEIGAKRR